MMKTDKKILLEESSNLIKEIHIPLFTDFNNNEYLNPTQKYRYFLTEKSARKHYCTHKKCTCGNIISKHEWMCDDCRSKRKDQRYNKLQFKEWDEKTPLVLFNGDTFFYSVDDIIEYCDDNDINSKDLQLVYAEPNYLHEIEDDYWEGIIPEDNTIEDIAPIIFEKIQELNNLIMEHKPVSWGESNIRTSVDSKNKEGK